MSKVLASLFLSTYPFNNYVTTRGEVVNFVNHKAAVTDPEIIAEMDAQINKGHPLFYRDPSQLEIDPEELIPEVAVRNKHRSDTVQELVAAGVLTAEQANTFLAGEETAVEVEEGAEEQSSENNATTKTSTAEILANLKAGK